MKIVQLSDIHFGAQFRDDIFNQVIDEVNELSPDAVIITGDLTNEGLKAVSYTHLTLPTICSV